MEETFPLTDPHEKFYAVFLHLVSSMPILPLLVI
jgi:hypothetical protein